jgi:hypothetical protein
VLDARSLAWSGGLYFLVCESARNYTSCEPDGTDDALGSLRVADVRIMARHDRGWNFVLLVNKKRKDQQ